MVMTPRAIKALDDGIVEVHGGELPLKTGETMGRMGQGLGTVINANVKAYETECEAKYKEECEKLSEKADKVARESAASS